MDAKDILLAAGICTIGYLGGLLIGKLKNLIDVMLFMEQDLQHMRFYAKKYYQHTLKVYEQQQLKQPEVIIDLGNTKPK